MNTIKKQKISGERIPPKKEWEKPTIITLKSEDLNKYIKTAAMSGDCLGWSR